MESYNKEHADNPIDIQYTDADASAALIDLYNGCYDDIMNLFKPSAIWEGIVRIVPNIPQTLEIAAAAAVIGIVLGFLLALCRIKKFPVLSQFATLYISFMRGTPLLVQLSIIYFGLFGAISIPRVTILGFADISRFIPGVVALALNSSAYVAEIFRAGILAVDKGQTEAARSLGLSGGASMRFVVLPQAIKNVLPALANEIVTMVKESSICSMLGMEELMFGAKAVASATYVSLAPYTLAALIYFCINYPASKAIEAVERRMRRGDKQ